MNIESLFSKIEEYKRKYYLNQLLKGLIFSAAVLLSAYLLFNTLEYFGRFGTTFRAVLFFTFLAALLFTLALWIIRPAVYLYGNQKPLSNTEAADQIGKFFPEIGDKLLNTLQLAKLSNSQNDLILASINQKSQQLGIVRFSDAVNLDDNRKYLKYALIPFAFIVSLLIIKPKFFSDSSSRIVNFKNEYAEEAPFSFILENKNLKAFRNEDYSINLTLQGNTIPESVYLVHDDRKLKMESIDQKHYVYTFRKVQKDFEFKFEAAGFKSANYEVELVNRPALLDFEVTANYPTYLNKPNEQFDNVGNLTVPEGTTLTWNFNVSNADSVLMAFDGDTRNYLTNHSLITGSYEHSRRAKTSGNYQVRLQNKFSANKDGISYYLNVIPDKYPSIALEQYKDSTLYNYLVLGGNIGDDYGISSLKVNYKVVREGQPAPNAYRNIALPVSPNQAIQSFYYQWQTDTLRLQPGDKIEYYVQVWDNDGVNGPKSAQTNVQNYAIPSKQAIENEIDKSIEKTDAALDKALEKTKKLREELAALENRLRNKKEIDFQDKKQAEDLIKKRQELMDEIQQLQQQNKATNEKQQRFDQPKQEMSQKMQELQKMMNELLDPETNKFYEELKKLLDQNQDEKMLEQLDKLKNKEKNMEKEIERMKELFKKLQLEAKLDKQIEDLKKLAEKQDKLADKTEKEVDKKDNKNADNKDKDGKDKKADNKDGKDKKEGEKKDSTKTDDKKDGDKKGDQKDGDKKDGDKKDGDKKDGDKKDGDKKDGDKKDGLQKEQESLKKEFNEVKKDLKDIEKESKELKNADPMDTDKQQQEDISNEQENSQEEMEKGENEKSSKSQRNASKSMRKLAQKLAEKKKKSEAKQQQENMDDLRDILENLIHVSYDQERLMKEFKGVNLVDPRFVKLSQEQLKIQDDTKVIEDSLYALSKRVMQIETFVTRELSGMKRNMDESVRFIKERRLGQATSKQQFAMTSVNNLALMLSDVLKQMQEQMQAMMMPGQGQGKKGNQKMPSPGKQQSDLNEQMESQSKGGKTGRSQSESLAKMAAQQGAIRKMIQDAMNKLKGTEKGKELGGQLGELMQKMEQTEEDLVNKRLDQNTINRNKQIVTRLLESEKAMQEQEEEQKRKSETARQQYDRQVPPAFQQYVKEKQKQTELLRTVPPSLSPFYKREVDKYFKKI